MTFAVLATIPLGIGNVEASEQASLTEALQILNQTVSGRSLLDRAYAFWSVESISGLSEHVRVAEVSRTDSVLVRKFDPQTGKESRERQVSVTIRGNQSVEAVALDLAHELVHATAAPSWDPYDPGLTPGKYVRVSIEGKGGEMEAVLSECRVGREHRRLRDEARARCQTYWAPNAALEKRAVLKDFYSVGRWFGWVKEHLGGEANGFRHLSNGTPKLFSSTGHAPYPVSLLDEYREITAIACENTKKRYSQIDRAPAAQSLLRVRCERGRVQAHGGSR